VARTRLRSKLVGNLTVAEYRACSQLTMRESGEMAGRLRDAWNESPAASRVLLLEDPSDGRLLAWALVAPSPGREPRLDVYVRRSHRRRGLGRRLLRAVNRYCERPHVCGWDPRSKAFFQAHGRERLTISYRG